MKWTEDGWLRMADGSNIAKEYCEESELPEYKVSEIPDFDDFDGTELGNFYYAPLSCLRALQIFMPEKDMSD